jgi:hypothetical protein
MSGTNNSATGGYVIDTAPRPSSDAIQAALQTMTAALSALPGTLVRPRWQPMPPVQPDANTTWASIGVVLIEADEFPFLSHVGSAVLAGQTMPGYTVMQRHMTLTVVATFYGPMADDTASMMRDAMYVPQNWEPLAALGIKLLTIHDLARQPELLNNQYIDRVDLRLELRMQQQRNYPIFDLDGADVSITDGRLNASASVRGAAPAPARRRR